MNTMHMPGFTAEASLYNGNMRYQATAEASSCGGIVQPAQLFSDSTTVSGGALYFTSSPPLWGNCLKWECVRRDPIYGWCMEHRWVHAIC